MTRLWSDVRVDDLPGTIGAFAAAAAEVVLAFAGTAGEDTADYLEAFRGAEHRGGPAYRFVPAPLPTAAEVADLIRGAALTGIVNSRRRGGDSRRALANGLVKTLGQAGKSVMDAGRETVVAGAKGDPAAVGWVRVLSPGACDFCQTLATRPPSTAVMAAHPHCTCTAELVYAPAGGRPPAAPAAPAATPAAPVPPPTPSPARARPFAERLAAALTGREGLAAALFGLGRKPRPDAFTREMSKAVNTYTGAEYAAINAHLRGTRMPYGYTADDVTETIAGLDKAFAASSLDADVLAFRGVLNARQMFGEAVDGDLTGLEWREDAPLSTSTLERRANGFSGTGPDRMVMRVLVPAGTGAVEASGVDLEAELLVARGARLRIVADRGVSPQGHRLIDVEVVGDAG